MICTSNYNAFCTSLQHKIKIQHFGNYDLLHLYSNYLCYYLFCLLLCLTLNYVFSNCLKY